MKKIRAFFESWINYLTQWPRWWAIGAVIVLLLIAFELIGTGGGFVWPIVGVIALMFQKTKDE